MALGYINGNPKVTVIQKRESRDSRIAVESGAWMKLACNSTTSGCKYIAQYLGDNMKKNLPFVDRLFVRYHASLDDMLRHSKGELQKNIGMIMRQVSVAVSWLHDNNITHGDVHAGNIFVEYTVDSMRCRLGDLGQCNIEDLSADQGEKISTNPFKILQLSDTLLDWLHTVLLGYHMMRVCCDNMSSTATTEAVWLGLNFAEQQHRGRDDFNWDAPLVRALRDLDRLYDGLNMSSTAKTANLKLLDCVDGKERKVQDWVEECRTVVDDIAVSKQPGPLMAADSPEPSRAFPLFVRYQKYQP
jgi:serine/threonine protein kinase